MDLLCSRCGDKVGEMIKGTMKHGELICLCEACNDRVQAAELTLKFKVSKKSDNQGSSINSEPLSDFFSIFNISK